MLRANESENKHVDPRTLIDTQISINIPACSTTASSVARKRDHDHEHALKSREKTACCDDDFLDGHGMVTVLGSKKDANLAWHYLSDTTCLTLLV